MKDRLKKSFNIANNAYVEALKFLKWLVIYVGKWAWVLGPPLILIEPLSFLAVPIIAYWYIFWFAYFWDDWISPSKTPIM